MTYATIDSRIRRRHSDIPRRNTVYNVSYAADGIQNENQIQLFVKILEKRLECLLTVDINAKVWEVKQQINQSLCSDVEENFNFGLYLPPHQKRLGKYMSEDRAVREYRLSGLPPTVFFKYYSKYENSPREMSKRMMTKAKDSQQRFFEYVSDANSEKCLKFLEKGLDPNFIHKGTGHTPLTKAGIGRAARSMIMLLCRYGAFLEFRDRNGYTALHHAAINGTHESMQVLLDAGASVNSRDLKGLTPLYSAICDGNSTYSVEILLKEKCDINVTDTTGHWSELHQACKRGKTDIVELLLLYGADINARTSAGNSALHIGASFNKVHSARQLLYRGVDKTMRNKAGQTAYEVAALTSNFVIMNDITNFKPSEAEPFATSPSFTNRKKQPVFNREGSASSNKSNSSNTDARVRGSSSTLTHTRALSAGAPIQRAATISAGDGRSRPGVAMEPTRTGSIGASSSASSTASSVRALPPEFPAPSNSTLQMTLEELIKTARICKIPKTKRGYGFHVKGLAEKKKEFVPSVEAPCSQFMFGVDKDSESHKAGVMANDFIYQVNGKDVTLSSHKDVVELIKKSGDPLVLCLIQVSHDLPAPAPVPVQVVVPPPAVPKRDPRTKLKGPRPGSIGRSQTVGAIVTSNGRPPSAGQEQIYANMQRATSPARVSPEPFRPPPPLTLVVPTAVTRTLERMNSAPGGMTRGDGYFRRNTMPVKPPAPLPEAEEKREEVVMIPVLPQNSTAEILEQRRRLTSVSGNADNQSLKSTQSEPAKPVYVSRSPDNRPVLNEPDLPKSKSSEDIARKAAEMRKKRGSLLPGQKMYNYDLPPPPTAIPPPPAPPDDLPPPPPVIEPTKAPSPVIEPSRPPPVPEPTRVLPPVTEATRVPPVTQQTRVPPVTQQTRVPPVTQQTRVQPTMVPPPVTQQTRVQPTMVPPPATAPIRVPPPATAPIRVSQPVTAPIRVPPPVTELTRVTPNVAEPTRAPSPPAPPPSVPEPEGDKEDNESYDSGFIQNGKHVEDWESVDVADWLSGLGLGEYKNIFIENDIKGPNLVDLTKNDLKELGVTKLGHRITMMKEINTRLSETR